MSSQPPHQSPLEQAKAEMNTLNQDFQKDLDNLRIAPLMEYETRITSLANTFQASQELATKKVESALDVSDERTRGLENNLRTQKALLQDAHQRLRAEKALADRLGKELSAEKEAAKNRDEESKSELAIARGEREEARSELQKALTELEQARRGPPDLQQELEAVKKRNVDFQKEAAVAEQYRSNLLKSLTSARSRMTQLKAKLQTTTTRARASKDSLNASQSSFTRFKEGLNALVDSYKEELTQTRPNSASSQHINPQDSTAEGNHGPQTRSHQVQTQATNPNLANSTSNNKANLLLCQNVLEEVMHQKHWPYNRHFLKPADPVASGLPMHLKATTQPMGLNAMKEKLAKGDYTSASSFKADFDRIIASSSKGGPLGHRVQTAGKKLLAIFEEKWPAARMSSQNPRGHTAQDQPSLGHKRKASTERPMSSDGTEVIRRALSVPPLNDHAPQPSRPSSGGRLTTRQTRSQIANSTSASSTETKTGAWKGQVIVGPNIQVDAKVDAIVKQVSVVKPVDTFDASFKDLFPDKLEVQGHVTTAWLEEELHRLNFTPDRDMVTFRIEPAPDVNNAEFDRLFNYFIRRERHGTVNHTGGHNVNKVYLIPVPAGSQYPDYISSLDYEILPGDLQVKVLLLVVVFQIKEATKEQIRLACDEAIKTVHNPEMKDLTGICNHLRHHPLPVLQPGAFVVSGAERHMPMLTKVSRSRTPAGLKVAASPQGLFRLSYPNLAESGQSSIDGVELPKCIFILGRVISPSMGWGLLVVDMEHDRRPLWEIMRNMRNESRLGNFMILMRSEFPSSLEEWESTITMEHRGNQLKKRLQLAGLKIERYRSSD